LAEETVEQTALNPVGTGATSSAADGRLAGTWPQAIARAGLIWVAFTALRWVVALVTEYLQPDHGRLAQGPLGLLKLGATWDSGYFVAVGRYGYFSEINQPDIWQAFFPGFPLAMRWLSGALTFSAPTDGRLVITGTLISQVCSLFVTVVIYRLAEQHGGRRAGVFAALLLMTWPTAIFLNAVYSESLYLAFAVGAWWAALRGRWWWAGLLCAGASFTRVNGLFLVAALLVMLLVKVYRGQERFSIWKVVALALGGTGTAAYLLYLWRVTGDLMAWQHAQDKGWARRTVWPWTAFTNTIDAIRGVDDVFRRAQWLIDMAMSVLGLLAAIYMAVRRYWAELALTIITFAVLLSSTNYLSIARSTLTIFPIFILGGGILARRPEWVSTVVLTLSGVWMLASTVLFTMTIWVG
jgi:hypothetical protein